MPFKNREARNAYARAWYARNRDEHRQRTRANTLRYRQSVADYLTALKSRPCSDCGASFDPEAMDFDHVRGEKRFNLSEATSVGYSLKTVEAEAAKCDVVCAVCHRLRTKARRQLNRCSLV